MKSKYFGIAAGITALISLFLPWFSIDLWTQNSSSTMNFVAYLYQLTGTVESVTKTMFLVVWFNAAALVLMLTTGVICVAASLFSNRRIPMLFVVSCALTLVAMTVFGFGLANSNFAVERLNPGYTISQFPQGTFGLTAEQSMQNSYDYSWAIGIGFWMALAVAILSLVTAIVSKRSLAKVQALLA